MTTTEKTYQHFAKVLTDLLGNDTAIRLTVNGYMPLSLEHIGQSAEGNRLIAISHTGEQNGDLMRDPEMVFEIHAHGMAEPLSFRNDYMGMMQEVYRYDDSGKKTHVNASYWDHCSLVCHFVGLRTPTPHITKNRNEGILNCCERRLDSRVKKTRISP